MDPGLTTWQFAAAGLFAASGPLLIHLLTRRRHRQLEWGAMELLLQAARESRRRVRLLDLILLVLRCLAVAMFGLALARPVLDRTSVGSQGVAELTVMIDNSLSMGYESIEGSRLDIAVREARRLMRQLPPGSQFRVAPLCGTIRSRATPILEDAIEALESIEIADRALSLATVAEAVRKIEQQKATLPRRYVVFSDLQAGSWDDADELQIEGVEVVDVADGDWENAWIASIRLQDRVLFAGTDTTIFIELGHRVRKSRDVQLTVNVDSNTIATRSITLQPAESQQLVVLPYHCPPPNSVASQSTPIWKAVTATITPDRLSADDARHLIVPVVTSPSVAFVDDLGNREDRRNGMIGETWPLRKLLAASLAAGTSETNLVHLRPDQLSQDQLGGVRVVVLAGLTEPQGLTTLLREYVQQGGQLMITAGGGFDPAKWTATAWEDGQGILPAPLKPTRFGKPPSEIGDLSETFSIAAEDLARSPHLQLNGVSQEDLRRLAQEPVFFEAVTPILGANVRPESEDDRPKWLRWKPPLSSSDAEPTRARVLARFDDPADTAFIVERKIGAGSVTFVSTGLRSEWNTLAQTNAVILLDRLMQRLLRSTLGTRNFSPAVELTIPLPLASQSAEATLRRPGQLPAAEPEPAELGFVSAGMRGVTVERLLHRGVYTLELADSAPNGMVEVGVQQFAINGGAAESDLSRTPDDAIARDLQAAGLTFDRGLRSTGSRWEGWHVVVLGVLVLLAAEMAILARRRND